MKKGTLAVAVIVALVALGGVATWRYLRPHQKNVLVLMLDTTRADHLGAYGYGRETSPTIDTFAKENVRFSYAVTAAPWTPPSVASMFTGVYPATHGWMPPNSREAAKKSFTKLDDGLVTLAEIFKANGYVTGAAVPNPWITEEFGYSQGFDSFWYKPRVPAADIVKAGLQFIDTATASGKPFFAYLHFLDPHDPYNPPAEFKTMFEGAPPTTRTYREEEQRKMNLYDAEIRYLDTQLGRLFDQLKERGLYDDLSIILLADHGEQFMERGNQGHGFQLFNEEVHVPLIVKSPKNKAPGVVDVTASTIDLFPTALASADIPLPQAVPGISLFDEEGLAQRKGVFTEINRLMEQRAFTTSNGLKLIVQENGEEGEKVLGLFDRQKDYLELRPSSDQELIATLGEDLKETRAYALEGRLQGETARGQLKDSTIEHLKTLGYLQ